MATIVSFEERFFGTVDLIVFIGLLFLALLIGIYYAVKDRRKSDTDTYYFGGKSMSPIPVGLSIAVTFTSAITIIGFPTEAYGYGSVTFWYTFSSLIPEAVASIYYVPLIHRLRLSTIYEYLELRFHKSIRRLQSAISLLAVTSYLGTATYLPALALNAVTPLSLTWTIVLTSGVCILYTTMGGMKAVVWTDTLQTIIMLVGMLAAFIKAIVSVGGMDNLFAALERGNRQNFLTTVSSGINAVGALILQDFILPRRPTLTDKAQILISKAIVATFGFLAMMYAFCMQYINTTILQIGFVFRGALKRPILAVFTLGIFFPWCNTKGALAGQIISTLFMTWVGVSGFVYGKPPEKYTFLPTSTDQCSDVATTWTNATSYTSSTQTHVTSSLLANTIEQRSLLQDTLFSVSPLYYTFLSFIITIGVALPVSFLTGANNPKNMDPKLFLPVVDNKCLPEKIRTFFRFGVPVYEKKSSWKTEKRYQDKADKIRFSPGNTKEEEVCMKTSVI